MEIAYVLIVFIGIAAVDYKKLLQQQDNKKKYMAIYFTILFFGCLLSILQLTIEDLPSPLLFLKNIMDKL